MTPAAITAPAPEQKPITSLADVLLRREMEKDPEQFRNEPEPRPKKADGPMSPETLGMLGAVADTAGTYTGMKAFGMPENNALINRVAGGNPELTAGLAGAGSVLARKLVGKLLRKISPAAADALNANMGSQQLGLGGGWLRLLTEGAPQQTGFKQYNDALDHWHVERDRRQGK